MDGLYFDQDRLAVVAGRLADPTKADQVVMTTGAAHLMGVRVGDVIHYGIYNFNEQNQAGFGTAKVRPYRQVEARLVGLVQVNNAVVEDDIDRYPTFEFFTPALGRASSPTPPPGRWMPSTTGSNSTAAPPGSTVEREFATVSPPGNTYGFHALAAVQLKVDRTIKPLVIALWVFGGMALLAALLIAIQVISRQLGDADDDLEVLRAFGAGETTLVSDSLIAVVAAVLAGSLLAAVVAVALSPLSPLGPVRRVYPGSAIAFDWTVLGGGVAVLAVALGSAAAVLAWRGAPRRATSRHRTSPVRSSRQHSTESP